MRQALRLVPLCALSFALCAAGFRALLPPSADGGLAAKLQAWRACRDEVDVLFLGSSRVAHGVVPEVFDAVVAEHGRAVHSFNLGVDAMGTFEADALLDEVLAERPPRLATVFVELDAWRPAAVDSRFLWTPREIRWHDLRRTVQALRSIRLAQAPLPVKLDTARVHVEHFLARALNLGLGRDALREALAPGDAGDAGDGAAGGADAGPDARTLTERRGYEPFPVRDADGPVFRGDRQRYLSEVERAKDRRASAGALVFFNVDALAGQVARIEAAGAAPVHFVTPTVRPLPFVDELASSGLLPALIALHDAGEEPGLFLPAMRYDDGEHLNDDGARAFTRRLAERWTEAPAAPGR